MVYLLIQSNFVSDTQSTLSYLLILFYKALQTDTILLRNIIETL